MKVGKELTIDVNSNYKIKIGTVDNKNPRSMYINLSAWGELNNIEDDNINYDNIINQLRKKIKQHINSNLNIEDFYKNKYIVDLDMRSSGISKQKRSFMSCEITLYQKNNIPINKPLIINSATSLIQNIISKCLEPQNYFTFYKTKN